MVIIVTALQSEATPFISHFALKKDLSIHAFPVYISEKYILCVAGKHPLGASAAVGYVCGCWGINKTEDAWLLHTGVCSSTMIPGEHQDEPVLTGSVLLPHTVMYPTDDSFSGENIFYPEPAYRHPFVERALVDGVAVAVLHAAARFLPLHRIIVAKGVEIDVSTDILAWFLPIIRAVDDEILSVEVCTESERQAIDETAEFLRLTHSMRESLRSACTFYKSQSTHKEEKNLVALLAAARMTPCTTKQEGKMALARLRQQLLD